MSVCPYCRDSEDFPIELDDRTCNVCGYYEDDGKY